jgi:hypothetical protein
MSPVFISAQFAIFKPPSLFIFRQKKVFLTTLIIFGNFVMSILSGESHGINGFDFGAGQRKRVSRENQRMV